MQSGLIFFYFFLSSYIFEEEIDLCWKTLTLFALSPRLEEFLIWINQKHSHLKLTFLCNEQKDQRHWRFLPGYNRSCIKFKISGPGKNSNMKIFLSIPNQSKELNFF